MSRPSAFAMGQMLTDIALPVPIDRTFTYIVPPEFQPFIKIGFRVLVPFGRKKLSGVAVGFPAEAPVSGLKPILDVLDAAPTFSEEMLRLTRWMSEYYFAPWGDVLKAAIPQGLTIESTRVASLADGDIESALEETKRTARKQHAILAALQQATSLTVAQLQKKIRAKSIHALLHELERRGWIKLEEVAKPKAKPKLETFTELTASGKEALLQDSGANGKKSPISSEQQRAILAGLAGLEQPQQVRRFLKAVGASLSTLKTLERKGLVALTRRELIRETGYEAIEPAQELTLNQHQERAVSAISTAIRQGQYRTFLLHGITGSGKTQVYIESIRVILAAGKTAIVLVPEISLTPQTVRRFKAHFGNDVTVMHSQMSVGERYDAWRRAHLGKVKIVIGPRSAIFAPLRNIGLIVVDEEHEPSYKQFDSTPRYNARDVAVVRASNTGAVVILGSATPSAESYYNALQGKYEMLELPGRIDNARLPNIEIVDMTKERKSMYEDVKKEVKEGGREFPKHLPIVSIAKLLKEKIGERLQRNEGTILLQNRRG
ncbi:MAG: primosomal protein N', partial [Ignavibacteria bacterium]|nr:primosomal protein N' [Ignavibacteria bacterium]